MYWTLLLYNVSIPAVSGIREEGGRGAEKSNENFMKCW